MRGLPTFTENWFGSSNCQLLTELVLQVADIPGRIIEIGSWEGRSTITLATAAPHREVHAVDTWRGSPSDISLKLAAERDVYATWRNNIDYATQGNVVEHRMDWREYVTVDDSPVALLFVDAEHTYDEVTATLRAFLPLMSPGGIICGDDKQIPGVWLAASEQLTDVQATHTMWWAWVGRGEA